MRFSVCQLSRRGGRELNEDRVGYCRAHDCAVLALADGMGGHPRGEVASGLVVQTALALFRRAAQPTLAEPTRFLRDAVAAGHRRLRHYASRHGLDDAPRTTFVACVLQDGAACWMHCGDSRLYLVRGGELVGRTRDHSYCERLDGISTTATTMPADLLCNRNVLFTCLGGPATPVIDAAGPLPLEPGDRLLLCSDGLWDNVDDETITERLAAAPVAQAVPALVELALRQGGAQCDNVSVLAVEWEPAQAIEDAASAADDPDGFVTVVDGGPQGSGRGAFRAEVAIERALRVIDGAVRRALPWRRS